MKPCIEPAPDEPDAEPLLRHGPFPLPPSPASSRVPHAEFFQLLVRASLPFGHSDVAHVAEAPHAHPAGPEPRRPEVPEPLEHRAAGGGRALRPLGPPGFAAHARAPA